MAPFYPPIISPVLKEAAELKIEELNRAKEAFKNRYHGNATILGAETDTLKRLTTLLEEIKKLDPYLEDDDDFAILTRYIEQAKDDRSVSQAKLSKFETQLLNKIALHAHRLDVSSLHADLLGEAMNSVRSPEAVAAKLENATLDDEFELVEGELEVDFERFERNAFVAKDVDTDTLQAHLENLFEGETANLVLQRLRNDIADYGTDVINGSEEVDDDTVEWCINDILQNRPLSDEKRKTLQGYLSSPAAISEVRSTLNMKSVRHWNWRNPDKGLPVTARQNVEGKYCITVEEETVDMLFLHSLAIGWSMKLKQQLKYINMNSRVWTRSTVPMQEDLDKHEYYLLASRIAAMPPKGTHTTTCTVCHPGVTICPPPPALPPHGGMICPPIIIPQRKKSKSKRVFGAGPPPPPPPPMGIYGAPLNEERFRDYSRHFFLSRLPQQDGCAPEVASVQDTQALLIKHLATEAKTREALDGEVHGLAANIESFASSISHETILTLLKFIGVPDLWLEIFNRFLKAPLNMGPLVRGTSDQVMTRIRGVPVAHGMELFFSELLLFFLDFGIHQKTGGYLYRLRDRCYFIGNAQKCKEAGDYILNFGYITGLTIHVNSLDEHCNGFLRFNFSGKSANFELNMSMVDNHARRVKKQLSACNTVIDWVRTWNATMGSYAPHLFGPLANVFGKPHLEAVKSAYNRMHEIIFEGGNLTDHVKQLLATHIRPTLQDPPFALEAFIFLPAAYGGLGVKNPYITLNLSRKVLEKPESAMQSYLETEMTYYKKGEENFKALTQEAREIKMYGIFAEDKERIAKTFGDLDTATYWPMEILTKHREDMQYAYLPFPTYPAMPVPIPAIVPTYNSLLQEPVDDIDCSERVHDSIRALSGRNGKKRWSSLSGEDRWVLQMYSDECFERYGGLEIWESDSVPLTLLKLLRGEEEEFEDDGSSVISDVTEC